MDGVSSEVGQGTKAAGAARDSFWRREGHQGGSHLTLDQSSLTLFHGLVMLSESGRSCPKAVTGLPCPFMSPKEERLKNPFMFPVPQTLPACAPCLCSPHPSSKLTPSFLPVSRAAAGHGNSCPKQPCSLPVGSVRMPGRPSSNEPETRTHPFV